MLSFMVLSDSAVPLYQRPQIVVSLTIKNKVQNSPKDDFDDFSLSILWLLQRRDLWHPVSLFPYDVIAHCLGKRHVLGEQRSVSQGCCPRTLSPQVIFG